MTAEMEARQAALGGQMEALGLDALVASSFENFYYSSGSMILTQKFIPSRLAFFVWTPQHPPTAIICSIEEAQLRSESWIEDIRTYVEFQDRPTDLLADYLTEHGLAAGRVGIELRCLPSDAYVDLGHRLPSATLVPADEAFDRVRRVKSDAEVATLAAAAKATDTAIRAAFEQASIGTTEREMARVETDRLLHEGADGLAFVVMSTGVNARQAHPLPTDLAVASGDLVRTDFGGYFGSFYGGYVSDLARTAVGGIANAKQRDTYARLFDVQQLLIDYIRPGRRACDVFELCRTSFDERGLDFRMPHVGHNIGLALHEHPMLEPRTTDELTAGMVMAIEPIAIDPSGIFHVEDMIHITERGCELLSPARSWAELFEIK